MLDVVGALVLGAMLAVETIVLIGWAAVRPAAKLVASIIAAAVISLLIGVGAAGGFATGAAGPVPAPVIAFAILLVGGLVAWFTSPKFRNALLSVPLWGLVGTNVFRVVGVLFLVLHERGRLAAPFAISAAWGDIITGLAAIPVAAIAFRRGTVPGWLLGVWNAFGTLDLITAVVLGGLSAPGTPFRVFTEAPGTEAMGLLPWVLVPAFLVPLYLMTHFAIFMRLASERAAKREAIEHQVRPTSMRGAGPIYS